jgi:hypothetical protein
MFERAGVSSRPEELTLLTEKLLAFAGGKSHVSAQQMVDFCADEADRHEWTLVGNRYFFAAISVRRLLFFEPLATQQHCAVQ